MNNIETLKMALKALEDTEYSHDRYEAITALRQAIEQAQQEEPDYYGLTKDHLWMSITKDHYDRLKPEFRMACYTAPPPRQPERAEKQELVTVLPDGSAFAVMSYPLPKDHWLYAEREYRDGEDEPAELGKPILTHQLRDSVVSAVRYAVRGATNCGKEVDFDPDALVQNAVYALCGPYGQAINAAEQREQTQKQEPVAIVDSTITGHIDWLCTFFPKQGTKLYTSPPPRQPLTDEEIDELSRTMVKGNKSVNWLARAIEAKLKEKNHD